MYRSNGTLYVYALRYTGVGHCSVYFSLGLSTTFRLINENRLHTFFFIDKCRKGVVVARKTIMKRFFSIVCALSMLTFVACSDDGNGGGDTGEIVVPPAQQENLSQEIGASTTEGSGVTFTTAGAWTSAIKSVRSGETDWVSITPDHGDTAGTYTISITLVPNETGEERCAEIIITCGDTKIVITIVQSATDEPSDGDGDGEGDEPSQGGDEEDENSKPQLKYVNSIDYRYTDYDDEYASEHITLTYIYDDQNQVIRVEEVSDSNAESYDNYEIWYTFDYPSVNNVAIVSSYKNGGDDSAEDKTHNVSLQNGIATQILEQGEYYEDKTTFSYNESGYLIRTVFYHSEYETEINRGGLNFTYTDGLLTSFKRDDEVEATNFDANSYYPNRYPNNKTNVDFNVFLINGTPELDEDITTLLLSLRMCGKFGDACAEIGGGGVEYFNEIPSKIVSDPNYREHIIDTTTSRSSSLYPAKYDFDSDGCPTKIYFDVIYDVYQIEYDLVADPNCMNGDMYRTTIENYTETKNGEIKCPAVYTITYKE